VARTREKNVAVPTYLDFFGMSRAPFARVSDATLLFHAEQYSLLYAHLSDATEHADRLLVIRGAEGLGKTTLLNRYTANLDPNFSFATFDQTCLDGTQFYCELLRQLGFTDITGTLTELRHISREFLIHRGLAGDPVLLIIDNAHLVSATILEQLQWLSNVEVKGACVISLVLAGNSDLARIMASPAMSLLKFSTHINFSIRVLTEQETDDYVRHRLRLAGGSESTKLATEARPLIHRFSGGSPRLINRLCNAVLTEALAQKTRVISEALVRQVADKHEFVPHVQPLQGQGRRKTDREVQPSTSDSSIEERISPREAPQQWAVQEFAAERGVTDLSVEKLLQQVSSLTDALDASRTAAQKVLLDVDARDCDINALLGKIEQQSRDLDKAATVRRDDARDIERLNRSLHESEQISDGLRDDLRTEERATGKLKTELNRASRKLEKLELRRANLQESLRALKAAQKKDATAVRRNQKKQDKKISDLERSVEKLQVQGDTLRARAEKAEQRLLESKPKANPVEDIQDAIEPGPETPESTQVLVADDLSVTRASEVPATPVAYVGSIGTIEVFRNGKLDHVVTLRPDVSRLMIGRSDDSELCLRSKFVSRHHALIFLARQRAYIEDLRSYNGTVVNAKKISRRNLKPDDTITIGDFELRPRHKPG
jgi:type II secretory pathway predicted ATPase ExeA